MREISLRVIYLGMSGEFSRLPLEALLAAGVETQAVVMPALAYEKAAPPYTLVQPLRRATPTTRRRALPLLEPLAGRTIAHVAAEQGIPVMEVSRLDDPQTVAALATYAPDAICVACFSQRLPKEILQLPRLGSLNVHPSMLPDNRGPDPLFWTFQRGDDMAGVTVHLMDKGLDTGPILLQRAVSIPEGASAQSVERECAQVGGVLLVEALQGLAMGTLAPQPQNERLATRYPWPSAEDYVITPEWPARRAFTFARGVGRRTQPALIMTQERVYTIIAALDYAEGASLGESERLVGDELWLQCSPGVLHARVFRQDV